MGDKHHLNNYVQNLNHIHFPTNGQLAIKGQITTIHGFFIKRLVVTIMKLNCAVLPQWQNWFRISDY